MDGYNSENWLEKWFWVMPEVPVRRTGTPEREGSHDFSKCKISIFYCRIKYYKLI